MANQFPKISIVTPTLNATTTLERAIQSVTRQQYPHIEHIIIDGGSSDGTLEVIRQNQAYITRWLSEKDSGTSDALNKGLRLASGEIIGLLLADDFYLEHTLAQVAATAHQYPQADVYYGDMVYVGPMRPPFRVHAKPNVTKFDFYRQPAPVYLPAVFIRQTAVKKYGLFDLDYQVCNDYELMLRYLDAGAKFQYINQVLVSMQWGGSSSRPTARGGQELRLAFFKYKPSGLARSFFELAWHTNNTKAILKCSPLTQPFVQFYRRLRERMQQAYVVSTNAEPNHRQKYD